MKRITFLIIALLSVCSLFAQKQQQHFNIKVGDFTNLRITDNVNVVYHADDKKAGTAVFDCDPQVANALMFTNNTKGKLTIQIDTDFVDDPRLPMVHVYSKTIDVLENAGDSTLTIHAPNDKAKLAVRLSDSGTVVANDLNYSELELRVITGHGNIIAGGKCDKVSLHNLGTGTIQAEQLKATNVDCHLVGTGTIGCWVNGGNLTVKGSGTGKVYYKGQPEKVKVRQLGTIKAIPIK